MAQGLRSSPLLRLGAELDSLAIVCNLPVCPVTRFVVLAVAGLLAAIVAVALLLNLRHADNDAPLPPLAATDGATAGGEGAKPVKADTAVPAFDVVRINREGNTVIAGRAAPQASVTILDDGKALGTVTADARGEWVFVPDVPLAPGSRTLTLKAVNPDGTTRETEEPVVLVVPQHPSEGEIPLAVKSSRNGSVVLQAPGDDGSPIAIVAVDQDAKGRTILGGKAPAKAQLHIYLDDKLVGRATSDANGRWRLVLKEAVPSGDHRLRADQVDGKGKVLARAEVQYTPTATSPTVRQATESGKVVVEQGNSLWRIAQKLYGDGASYAVIYKANRQQIRDPDLIYPGQVFVVPAAKP